MRIAIAIAAVLALAGTAAAQTTHKVGPNEAFTDIASAEAASAPGDTILILKGRYILAAPVTFDQAGVTILGKGAIVDGAIPGGNDTNVDGFDITAAGVTVQGVTSDLAAGLGLNKAEGALVSGVTSGGAADKAGIKRGDVITSYQGRAVLDTNSFRNEIAATKPGTTITLGVLRNGRTSEIKATLSEYADAQQAGRDANDREGEGSAKYGMTVEPLTPEIARQLEIDRDRDVRGVVISDVEPSGAAASAGLREGDVIQQVNGKPVRTAEDVRSALNSTGGKPAVLLITRGNHTIFVPLRAR